MPLGKSEPKGTRPPDQIAVLKSDDIKESNQIQFAGPNPVKPQVLQPKNLSKRVQDLEIPANFDA